ncbi:MAG: glycosyltransferase family 2 protein [Gammaproteobacteria bacterium]|nr:glycosyltransferase family 2 protein [Gammaproteobacteria bacterium]MDH5628729.1 glycosyltransferase family 2 protein [Gammaproteobacteria bacterium]
MKPTKLYPQRWYDFLLGYFFRAAASNLFPASWFRDPIPAEKDRKKADGDLVLEIVSHCWNYGNMLAYQLSSFVNYPPTKLSLIVTVFYSEEDKRTAELIKFIGKKKVKNVTWNFVALEKPLLFRRGIGRNMASKNSRADWLWFTDCDIIFHKDCLDTLADELQGRQESLLFPRQERTTPMLAEDDPMLQMGSKPQLVDIEDKDFTLYSRDRAKGAFQIVHGDVARAIGYCDGLSLYQTPSDTWCKCYEDRAFRWLLGTRGIPVDVPGVYQIRHIFKGRYKPDSKRAKVRSKIRQVQNEYREKQANLDQDE